MARSLRCEHDAKEKLMWHANDMRYSLKANDWESVHVIADEIAECLAALQIGGIIPPNERIQKRLRS